MHEIGHYIDWHINNRWSKKPPSGAIGKELMALGKALYGNKQPSGGYKSEGYAEFIREYLTGGDLEAMAPNMHKWFTETYLPAQPKIAKSLERVGKLIRAYQTQGAVPRFRSMITQKPLKGSVGERFERMSLWFERSWRTEGAALRRGIKKAGLTGQLRPSEDPFELFTAYADKAGSVARRFVLNHTTDLAGNPNGKSLTETLKDIDDIDA